LPSPRIELQTLAGYSGKYFQIVGGQLPVDKALHLTRVVIFKKNAVKNSNHA
jgi:hypothetical protein